MVIVLLGDSGDLATMYAKDGKGRLESNLGACTVL